MTRNNSDSAWKEILDNYLKNCVDYCFPQLSGLINWKKPCVSLDKEFRSITRGVVGKRLLDKLFKVFLKDGREQWCLLHVEVQSNHDDDFPKRMFTYAYRIYDKYQQPVISCAILTDDKKDWRPTEYKIGLAGSYLSCEFLIVKILDFHDKINELESSTNPFASVIISQLLASETKKLPHEERKKVKFILAKRLFDKGFNKKEVQNLYKFIDWVIGLPKQFELEYLDEVYEIEDPRMAYISNIERIGIAKGVTKERKKIAKNLLDQGLKPAFVKKTTGLPVTEIKKLQKEIKN